MADKVDTGCEKYIVEGSIKHEATKGFKEEFSQKAWDEARDHKLGMLKQMCSDAADAGKKLPECTITDLSKGDGTGKGKGKPYPIEDGEIKKPKGGK